MCAHFAKPHQLDPFIFIISTKKCSNVKNFINFYGFETEYLSDKLFIKTLVLRVFGTIYNFWMDMYLGCIWMKTQFEFSPFRVFIIFKPQVNEIVVCMDEWTNVKNDQKLEHQFPAFQNWITTIFIYFSVLRENTDSWFFLLLYLKIWIFGQVKRHKMCQNCTFNKV